MRIRPRSRRLLPGLSQVQLSVLDPGELIELMTLVLDSTLDARSRDDLTRMPPSQAAREQYRNQLKRYASPHEWWRIATLPDGEPVGFVIYAHNGLQPHHRLPQSGAGASRLWLYSRRACRGGQVCSQRRTETGGRRRS
jgi:hypothetical protein